MCPRSVYGVSKQRKNDIVWDTCLNCWTRVEGVSNTTHVGDRDMPNPRGYDLSRTHEGACIRLLWSLFLNHLGTSEEEIEVISKIFHVFPIQWSSSINLSTDSIYWWVLNPKLRYQRSEDRIFTGEYWLTKLIH